MCRKHAEGKTSLHLERKSFDDVLTAFSHILCSRTESGTSARQNDVPNPNGFEYG